MGNGIEMVDIRKARLNDLDELVELWKRFMEEHREMGKKWKEDSGALLSELITAFKNLSTFTAEDIENTFKNFIESKELGLGAVLPLFRLTVTGMGHGPSMFAIAELLGKEETIRRMESGIKNLG